MQIHLWSVHVCMYADASFVAHSGMAPFIRAVFGNLIGEKEAGTIDIVSNDADIHPDGTWEIKFRHPTRYVHSPFSHIIERPPPRNSHHDCGRVWRRYSC